MTNYEKIKQSSINDLAQFLAEIEGDGGPISDEKYCGDVCVFRAKEGKGCTIGEDEPLPCMELTRKECIHAWLNANAEGSHDE